MSRQDARATTCHFPQPHKTPSESCSALTCGYTLAESTARERPPQSPAPGGE